MNISNKKDRLSDCIFDYFDTEEEGKNNGDEFVKDLAELLQENRDYHLLKFRAFSSAYEQLHGQSF